MSWRELARDERWSEIWPHKLNRSELTELQTLLQKVVPVREMGDGVETFIEHIRAHEARTRDVKAAASLLVAVRRTLRYFQSSLADSWEQSPELARKHALRVLQDSGIGYHGSLASTYVYWRENGTVVTLRPGVGEEISRRFREKIAHSCVADVARWKMKHRWRSSPNLQMCHHQCLFGENTLIDHALRLISDFEHLDWQVRNPETQIYDDPIQLAYQIGREHEALLKKVYEPHAVRGIGSVTYGAMGGDTKGANYVPRNREVIDAMRPLIEKNGLSASRAGQIVFARGIGASGDGNRKVWERQET